ncbi:unnamed protein product [Leuciscus chuanchicus]
MVLGRIFHALINNAQVVEKLAESRAIRRAAQITVFAITKAQIAGKNASNKLLTSHTYRQIREETSQIPSDVGELGRRASRLRETFVKEVKEGMKDANRRIKDKKKSRRDPFSGTALEKTKKGGVSVKLFFQLRGGTDRAFFFQLMMMMMMMLKWWAERRKRQN